MRILIISIMFITSLFSVERMENLNLKINNDEHIYKERLINQELFGEKFKKVVGIKSCFLYNEFIVEDTLMNVRISYIKANNRVEKKIQFIIKKNSEGSPSIYKVRDPINLDSLIKQEFDNIKNKNCTLSNFDKENCYFIPTHMNSNYDNVVNFLKDSYNFKLRLEINDPSLIKQMINTNKLYLSFVDDDIEINTINEGESKLFFDFSKGLVSSKNKDFKNSVVNNINKNSFIHEKNIKPKYTPSLFLQIIEEEDDFKIYIEEDSDLKELTIEDFYFVKVKIQMKN